MKTVVTCVASLSACAAICVEVAALPDAVFTDAEVSTNFTFAVGAIANRRLVFTVELQASPSNNVEIAIGCDANCDGRLSLQTRMLPSILLKRALA